MENTTKYYTPELNEFYVGFEYESTDDFINWRPKTFDNLDFRDVELMLAYGVFDKRTPRVRVKKLSRECIESLGYVKSNTRIDYGMAFKRNNSKEDVLYAWFNNDFPTLRFYDSYPATLCQATVKNKSELSKLMTMLNIKI